MPEALADLRLTVRREEEVGFGALQEALADRGFERASMVEEVGQYAVRGGILDLFSFGAPEPVRLEFWGDEVVSIRTFDILDQRSTGELDEVHVLPVDFRRPDDSEAGGGTTRLRSLLDLVPREAILVRAGTEPWEEELHRTWRHVREVHDDLAGHGRDVHPPADLFLEPGEALEILSGFPVLELTAEEEGDAVVGASPNFSS